MTMVSKTFAEVLTFTRASTGTYFDASGVLQTAAVDEARFTHDPDTLDPEGILIEESRTNLFLNSDAPATQNITVVVDTTYTVSVIGTGSADLSDAGTGSATEGSPVTFTATTNTLTVTITGTVDYCQVEAGSDASSMIITAGTSVTREPDIITTRSDI